MKNNESLRNVFVGVDIQNDFIDGTLAVHDGTAVVQPANEVAAATRAVNGMVAWTRDWHPAQTPHFAEYGGLWPSHCVAETEGAEFNANVEVLPTDYILSKGMGQTDGYSGWEARSEDNTSLETLLTPKRNERVRVFLGGLATDYCVKATALDIARAFSDNDRLRTYLIADAARAVNLQPQDGDKAIAEMVAAGITPLESATAIELIQGAANE